MKWFLTILMLLIFSTYATAAAPDQTTSKYAAPDQTTQMVQQKVTPQKYVPDQTVRTYGVPDQTKASHMNVSMMLFERQPCQPLRNIARRIIREKIKDRLIPTPPGFNVSASFPCVGGMCR